MQRSELEQILQSWLNPEQIKDYCPNGLQVEGKTEINRIVTGVTASQALIDCAIAEKADALLVHHGYFWKGEDGAITGMKYRRVRSLIEHSINLFAYHLPLDVHPEFGNNVRLLDLLGMSGIQPVPFVEPEGILMTGQLDAPESGEAFVQRTERALGRPVVAAEVNDKAQQIRTVAVCTGGGQGFIEQALASGADLFITGEVSEQTIHVARECGIQFIAAGHHATERYGVKALGEKLAAQYDLDVTFIDIDNPA